MFAIIGLTPLAGITGPVLATLQEYLEREIRRRTFHQLEGRDGRGVDRRRMTVAIYNSQLWDIVKPQHLFTLDLMEMLPPALHNCRLLVTFKHTLPLHRRVCNKRAFFQKQSLPALQERAATPCVCGHLPDYQAAGHDHHVITADMRCAGHLLHNGLGVPEEIASRVEELLNQGTNYRPLAVTHLTEAHRAQAVVAWKQGLHNWVAKVCEEHHVPITQTLPFVEAATARFQRALAFLEPNRPIAHPNTLRFGDDERRAFQLLGEHFLITTCDKASRNFALVCKTRVAQLLMDDLNLHSTGVPVYRLHHVQDVNQCIQDMTIVVNRFHLQVTPQNESLPFYSAAPKLHKRPFGMRWLTIGHVGVFVPLYKRIHWACKALKPSLHQLWLAQFRDTGVPREFWSPLPELLNSTEAVSTIKQCNAIGASWFFGEIRHRLGVRFPHIPRADRPQVVTADVTRLYTHIPHQDLIQTIHWIIDTVFDHQNQPLLRGPRHRVARQHLLTTPDSHEWLRADQAPARTAYYCPRRKTQVYVFTRDTLKAMITEVLSHCLFQVGDAVYVQQVGVPMGASCSPDLVNLYAFFYELNFLTRATTMYSGMGVHPPRVDEATLLLAFLRFFRRFLDDIILITIYSDKQLISSLFSTGDLVQAVPGIYPLCLAIQDTSLPDQSNGHFMDLDIRWHYPTRNFITGVFDKRNSPEYSPIPHIHTVPSAHSCLAEQCKLGVIFSQLWRFRNICTTADGWLTATVDFYHRFRQAGYPANVILRRLYKALYRIAPFLGQKPQILRRTFEARFGGAFAP
eukprot:jgi/Botrbrau1/6577/Bobra.0189s0004.1